jgi:hypothetical protein
MIIKIPPAPAQAPRDDLADQSDLFQECHLPVRRISVPIIVQFNPAPRLPRRGGPAHVPGSPRKGTRAG